MRIMYDYQILASQKYGGISRYFFELAKGMKEKGCQVHVPVLFSKNAYFQGFLDRPVINPAWIPGGRGTGFFSRKYTLCQNRSQYDIIHPTYYDPYLIGKFDAKLIITVYDMVHERFMEQDAVVIGNKKKCLYGADKIIAISECTKKDILKYYPDIPEEKISVIYLGNSMSSVRYRKKPGLPGKYVLFIGNRHQYKNFTRFLNAMRDVLHKHPDISLVCGGGGCFGHGELRMIEKLGLDGRVMQYDYWEDEAYSLYQNAICFIFPSLYEGFGLPLLESMAAGCPLACSRASCFPEIAGDGALYFDGRSKADMCMKINRLIEDREFSHELVQKGTERLKKFTWDNTVSKTLALYRDSI